MARRRSKLPGRFCWCCGCRRPNERFSGKRRVCRDCERLGPEEIAYRQHVRNIDQLLTQDGVVRRAQRRTFAKYLAHPEARVRAYAERVRAQEEAWRKEQRELWADLEVQEEAMLAGVGEADFLWEEEEEREDSCESPAELEDIPF
jgi:ribosome-binding protein aMBF1 (putative translation factor)